MSFRRPRFIRAWLKLYREGGFTKRQPVTKNEIIGARSALFSNEKLDIKKLNKELPKKRIC